MLDVNACLFSPSISILCPSIKALAPPSLPPSLPPAYTDDPSSSSYVPYLRGVSGDAMNKPNHFRNCAQSTAHIKPNVARFYNEQGQAHVEERVKAGTLTLAETFKAAVPGHEASCSASVHCARPDSTHSNVATDITGVVGLVCVHTVPLTGAFLDMRTHENFSYYLIILRALVAKLCEATAVGWERLMI